MIWLTGCTTIHLDYSRVDKSDGINKTEAVAIARKYLLDKQNNYENKFDLERGGGKLTKNAWNIFFPDIKDQKVKWYGLDLIIPMRVRIDPETGEVFDANVTKGFQYY